MENKDAIMQEAAAAAAAADSAAESTAMTGKCNIHVVEHSSH
jgi:hypothetical protein